MVGDSRCVPKRAIHGLVLATALLLSAGARGDDRVQFLSDRLVYPPPAGRQDDFRVRTNAALALGATGDEAAVSPLCGALGDPSDAVRQAAAVGLRRLGKPSASECLQDRLTIEASAAVRAELRKAVAAIDARRAAAEAVRQPPSGTAKY